jgi:tryptophan synthase alpha chain
VRKASGFVYYVSVTGVTGTRSASEAEIAQAVERLRRFTELPVAVGFGIKTPDQASSVARVADAAVVGSALVGRLAENLDDRGQATAATAEAVLGLARELSNGVRNARSGGVR